MIDANWLNDAIQFPRLLAELRATGIERTPLIAEAAVSMDLEPSDLSDLFDRAQAAWDAIVAATPGGPFPTIVWPEAEYHCLDCGRDFPTSEAMNDHIDEAHNEGYGTSPAEPQPIPYAATDDMPLGELIDLAEKHVSGYHPWSKWLEHYYDPAKAELVELLQQYDVVGQKENTES